VNLPEYSTQQNKRPKCPP